MKPLFVAFLAFLAAAKGVKSEEEPLEYGVDVVNMSIHFFQKLVASRCVL